ncbi:MAG: hypothetical protein DRP93_06605 [Candidatus Neomarinimicrobiota bacterium]|nr:MAG: hypothetical protein DRP93_06605 [Candidatus Neomarinimicrobiota bacterium]
MAGARSGPVCTVGIMGGNPGEQNPAKHSGVVNRQFDNVVIKNIEIANFCGGIGLGDMVNNDVDNNTVIGCNIHECGDSAMETQGIHMVHARTCEVTKNEVYDIDGTGAGSGCSGGGNGIFMYGANTGERGWYNNFTGNYLHNNAKSGFFMKHQCKHCTINNNKATENADGGIVLMCVESSYNTIEGNNASENVRYGIFIGSRNNTIRYNTITNNGYCGLDMGRSDGSYNNKLYENTVCGNSECDIRTCGPECYENHGYNNTCNTTQYYGDDDSTTGCTYDCEPCDVGCVAEDGTVFRCGDAVTKNCTLNGNMNCRARYGLIIGADNITIDGAGYALDRADSGKCTSSPSAGILNKGYDDVVVTNLEVKHFCNGIYLNINADGGNVVYRNTIENCNIHHNGNVTSPSATHGIKMQYVFNSTIRNNSIHDQVAYAYPNPGCEDGGNGLFSYEGEYNNIIGNRFYNNQKAGMLIKMKPKYWNISHNHLWGNGQAGIILRCMQCDFNLIEHNNASDNYGSGIFIGGNYNLIRYNTVCNNRDGGLYYDDGVGSHGYGINMGRSGGSLNNTLIANTVCGNDYLDMRVVTGVTGNHGSENICNTTYNYNDDSTTGCTHSCGTPQRLGDLNGDSEITPADAVIALQMAVRGEYSEDADVSGDHKVTSLDALLILQAAAEGANL